MLDKKELNELNSQLFATLNELSSKFSINTKSVKTKINTSDIASFEQEILEEEKQELQKQFKEDYRNLRKVVKDWESFQDAKMKEIKKVLSDKNNEILKQIKEFRDKWNNKIESIKPVAIEEKEETNSEEKTEKSE